MRTLRPLRLVRLCSTLALALVVALLPALGLTGCRKGGGTGDADGSGDPAETGGAPALLWSWPAEAGTVSMAGQEQLAFFRFDKAPAVGSLACTIEPEAGFSEITYNGQMVIAHLGQLKMGQTHKVVLKDVAAGAELGTAYVKAATAGEMAIPYVTASEGRERTYASGGYEGEAGFSTPPLTDGAKYVVGPGDVTVDIVVPVDVSEQAIRAALTLDPAGPVQFNYVPNWGNGNVLQVRWPGLRVTGDRLPDPLKAASTSSAPQGFSLKMSATIDAGKLPAFAAQAGSDGLFRVDIERAAAPDFTVRSLDDSQMALPYPGERTVYHLAPGAHRFRFEFFTPMDPGSVERALSARYSYGTGALVWEFAWPGKDSRVLEVTVTPPAGVYPFYLQLLPWQAMDQAGLPLWFVEGMEIGWERPLELVSVAVSDPAGAAQAVTTPPPGVTPKSVSANASYILGFESWNPEVGGDGPMLYHPWQWAKAGGRWTDWAAGTFPWQTATWLGDDTLFVDRVSGWEIIQAATGSQRYGVDIDRSKSRLVAAVLSPDASRVAVFASPWNNGSAEATAPVDLSLLALDGKEVLGPDGTPLPALKAVTRLTGDDFYLDRLPAAWLPGGEGLVFVDRSADGAMRLALVDLASGQVTTLPGTEGTDRWQPGTFVVFGANPTYCVFRTISEDGNSRTLVIYDVAGKKPVARLPLSALGFGTDVTTPTCLPSPDSRYLAVSGQYEGAPTSFVLDLAATLAGSGPGGSSGGGAGGGEVVTQPVGAKIEGTIVGWSPDSLRVYVSRPAK